MVKTSTLPDDDVKGNEEDGRDLSQAHYDEQFNRTAKAQELADLESSWNTPYKGKNGQHVDSHGDTVQDNPNADLKQQEENPKKPSGSGSATEETTSKNRTGSRWKSKLLANAKRYGASGAGGGVLIGGFFGISLIMVPGSLLVTIEKAITNDSADSTRTNIVFRRAYVSKLFSNEKSKSGNKIEDDLTKMSDAQKGRWEKAGFKVDLDDKGKITKMTFPDGTDVKTGSEFNAYAENTPAGRDATSKVLDVRSAFYQNQEFKDLLKRFNIDKGNRIKNSTDEDPQKRKEALDKNFDEDAHLQSEPDEQKRFDTLAKDTVGESGSGNVDGSKLKGKVTDIADKSGKAGLLSAPLSIACATYNVAKLTNATIKAKWIYDLISFAYPFVRAAAQIEDQGNIEPEVVDSLASRLTWFNPDPSAPDYNKTALDSQGLQMAIYGDLTGLTNFTKKFTSWGWETAVDSIASSYVNTAQSLIGKQRIKQVCKGAKAAQELATIQCIAGVVAAAVCVAAAIGAPLAEKFLLPYVVAQLAKPALHFLATVDLSSALEGEGAGDAIAAGIGLLLSGQTLGSGLIPAGGPDALKNIYKFIADTNDVNYSYTTQLALDEAKKNPFDVTNQYSFMGQLASMLNPYLNGDGTVFSKIASMTSVIGSSFGKLPMTANALFSQPSNMTLIDGLTNDPAGNRIEKCKDTDMADIGAVCDWSGRIVGYTSDTVVQGLDAIANNTAPSTDLLDQSIQAMTSGGKDKRDIDPNTGQIRSGSDFDNYVKYCVTRQADGGGMMPIGSSTASITDDNYDWTDGSKCMPQNTDPSELDHFATYYNWCYIQYATAERVNNCVDKKPEADSAANVSSNCGDGTTASIYKCALQFDPYTYQMGAGHPQYGTTSWYQSYKSSPPSDPNALKFDCSSLVMASVVAAFGHDVPNMTAPASFQDTKYWKSVPKDQATQGDVVVFSGHVEIIKSNDTASSTFTTFGAHTDTAPVDQQIGETHYSYSSVDVGTFRYVGSGSTGTGNLSV